MRVRFALCCQLTFREPIQFVSIRYQNLNANLTAQIEPFGQPGALKTFALPSGRQFIFILQSFAQHCTICKEMCAQKHLKRHQMQQSTRNPKWLFPRFFTFAPVLLRCHYDSPTASAAGSGQRQREIEREREVKQDNAFKAWSDNVKAD